MSDVGEGSNLMLAELVTQPLSTYRVEINMFKLYEMNSNLLSEHALKQINHTMYKNFEGIYHLSKTCQCIIFRSLLDIEYFNRRYLPIIQKT